MFEDYYRVGNKKVLITCTKPSAGLRLLAPVRTMVHIPKRFRVKPGSVLFKNGEAVYMLSQHHSNPITDVFAALEVNTMVQLSQSLTTKHPVTQMASNRTVNDPEPYPACKDVISPTEVIGLQTVEIVYYLARAVTKDHFIDGQRVKNCILMNGLYRVEVS